MNILPMLPEHFRADLKGPLVGNVSDSFDKLG